MANNRLFWPTTGWLILRDIDYGAGKTISVTRGFALSFEVSGVEFLTTLFTPDYVAPGKKDQALRFSAYSKAKEGPLTEPEWRLGTSHFHIKCPETPSGSGAFDHSEWRKDALLHSSDSSKPDKGHHFETWCVSLADLKALQTDLSVTTQPVEKGAPGTIEPSQVDPQWLVSVSHATEHGDEELAQFYVHGTREWWVIPDYSVWEKASDLRPGAGRLKIVATLDLPDPNDAATKLTDYAKTASNLRVFRLDLLPTPV